MSEGPGPVMSLVSGVFMLLIFGGVILAAAAPFVIILDRTKHWKHYIFIWLPVILAAVGGGIHYWSVMSLRGGHEVSGPTGPFGDAPRQALFLVGFSASLVTLIYAFTIGFPWRQKRD